MKHVLLYLLVSIILTAVLLAVIAIAGLPTDADPDLILIISLPLALLALAIIGWIQKWGRARVLLGMLVGPLLLLALRVTFGAVDRWLAPLTHPDRMLWAIALDVSGMFLSFLTVTGLYVWLLRKLGRQTKR